MLACGGDSGGGCFHTKRHVGKLGNVLEGEIIALLSCHISTFSQASSGVPRNFHSWRIPSEGEGWSR